MSEPENRARIVVPVVAHERPHRGPVLAAPQRALEHERAVLRPHRVGHRVLGRAEHEIFRGERAERVEVAQLLLRVVAAFVDAATKSLERVGVADARHDRDRRRRDVGIAAAGSRTARAPGAIADGSSTSVPSASSTSPRS